MSELWSGPGCEASAKFAFDHVSANGIRMFRKVGPRCYIGDAPNASGQVVPIYKRAAATGEAPRLPGIATAPVADNQLASGLRAHPPTTEGEFMTTIQEAVASFDDVMEKVAKAEHPDVSTAEAVTRFLGTPAGSQMYTLRDALTSLSESRSVDPDYAAVEVIADAMIAKGAAPGDAYARAFDRAAGR